MDLEVSKVVARIKNKDIHVTLNDAAQEFLIEKGYDPTYGARPMRRAVEKYMEDPLAEELLRGNIKAGDTLEVTLDGTKLGFHVARARRKPAAVNLPRRLKPEYQLRN